MRHRSNTYLSPHYLAKIAPAHYKPYKIKAFTLVELMAVVGVIALLAVVGVPAMKGLTASGGRKQALVQIIGAMEVARNTSISSGTNAAVIFPDATFQNESFRYRSLAVIAWNATNSTNGTNFMVGPWVTLPQGIVLHATQINQLPPLTNPTSMIIPPALTPISVRTGLRAIVFQPDGGLEDSYYRDPIRVDGIAFYEGVVASGARTIPSGPSTNLVETIRLTRTTGRPITCLARPR